MRFKSYFSVVCLSLLMWRAAHGQPNDAGVYRLVWADEFNVDGPPDPQNWTYERGFVRNEELQWYTSANARCEGGLLVIEARRERIENPRYDQDSRDWKRQR
jgi:beta-glucanase (GH16 family)